LFFEHQYNTKFTTVVVKDLVSWITPALARDGVREGWKEFIYALEGFTTRSQH
jgi:hypothetical protein